VSIWLKFPFNLAMLKRIEASTTRKGVADKEKAKEDATVKMNL
jgi:hypothetical protein